MVVVVVVVVVRHYYFVAFVCARAKNKVVRDGTTIFNE